MLIDLIIWFENNALLVGGILVFAILAAFVLRSRKNTTGASDSGASEVNSGIDRYARASTAPGDFDALAAAPDHVPVGKEQALSGEGGSGFRNNNESEPKESFDPVHNVAQARHLLHSIQGDPPRRQFSFLYVFAMAVVAMGMLLLPCLYLVFVTSVAWGVRWHIVENHYLLSQAGSVLLRSFLYITPIVTGAVVVLFLLKPLFARRAREVPSIDLNEADQPLLFAFVRELCLTLGAPIPKKITVMCDANAGASLRHGLWSIIRPGGMQLHIGLPLAAGLSLQEFSGVLAHELGHFTQGTAMRINLVIRAVNRWFARLVYEKDSWDVTLDHMIQSSPSLLPVVFLIAKMAVSLGRFFLWLLMHIGHAMSCFLMRQQEHDADKYQAYIAGRSAFAETMGRTAELGLTSHLTGSYLQKGLERTTLPDDYVDLFVRVNRSLPPDLFEEVRKDCFNEKTSLFSTHPSPAMRVKKVEQQQLPGIFHPPAVPATVLFRNLDELSKQVSLTMYRQVLGRLVDKRMTAPVDQFLERLEKPVYKAGSSPW